MPLAPVERRSVPDGVFDQLVDGIVAGELAVGERLPSERRLAEVLGVSRPAVREALQRLTQSGLVATRHGGASTVRDYRDAAGPDLLPRLLVPGGRLDPAVARSIVEVRSHVGPQIARLCAERAGDDVRGRLHGLADELGAADSVASRQDAALAFWDAVVAGADNLAYRLLWNSLRATYRTLRDVVAVVMADEVGDVAGHRAIADAVVAHDPDAAEGAARSVLARGTRAALAVLEAVSVEQRRRRPRSVGEDDR